MSHSQIRQHGFWLFCSAHMLRYYNSNDAHVLERHAHAVQHVSSMATARLQSVAISFYFVKNWSSPKQQQHSMWLQTCNTWICNGILVHQYHAKQLDFHNMPLHCLHNLSSKHALLVYTAPRHGAAAQHVVALPVSREQ